MATAVNMLVSSVAPRPWYFSHTFYWVSLQAQTLRCWFLALQALAIWFLSPRSLPFPAGRGKRLS